LVGLRTGRHRSAVRAGARLVTAVVIGAVTIGALTVVVVVVTVVNVMLIVTGPHVITGGMGSGNVT
jgi:hypothetical protein